MFFLLRTQRNLEFRAVNFLIRRKKSIPCNSGNSLMVRNIEKQKRKDTIYSHQNSTTGLQDKLGRIFSSFSPSGTQEWQCVVRILLGKACEALQSLFLTAGSSEPLACALCFLALVWPPPSAALFWSSFSSHVPPACLKESSMWKFNPREFVNFMSRVA